jgi:hypothetical protein
MGSGMQALWLLLLPALGEVSSATYTAWPGPLSVAAVLSMPNLTEARREIRRNDREIRILPERIEVRQD